MIKNEQIAAVRGQCLRGLTRTEVRRKRRIDSDQYRQDNSAERRDSICHESDGRRSGTVVRVRSIFFPILASERIVAHPTIHKPREVIEGGLAAGA
jgi:hypothetical protein